MSKSLNVKVCCRIRPENETEKQNGLSICMEATSNETLKILSESKSELNYTFDHVYSPSSTQEEIFTENAKPLIDNAMKGINGTLFCYGQTSSGKTFTMEGIKDDPKLKGVIPRMMEYIFSLTRAASTEIEFSIRCQYYQIYNEKIQDLLNKNKTDLSIRENKERGIWIEDCTEVYVTDYNEMLQVFLAGMQNRTVAETAMNKGSSRSHSIFSVSIFQRNIVTNSSKTGKLSFVDLAGSEKMSKTGITGGKGLKEMQNINKSLMTLGMVINALSEGANHVPYRDSKLTRVLQESLGGNSLTTLIVTCSPNLINHAESLSTLRFGQRAKLIKNKVVANTQQSAKELLMKLNKANEKIAALEKIITEMKKGVSNNRENKGEVDNTGNKDDNKKNNDSVVKECQECIRINGLLAISNNDLANNKKEIEELQKDKNELINENREKNRNIFDLNEKIHNLNKKILKYKKYAKKIDDKLKSENDVFDTLSTSLLNLIDEIKKKIINDDNLFLNPIKRCIYLIINNHKDFMNFIYMNNKVNKNKKNKINLSAYEKNVNLTYISNNSDKNSSIDSEESTKSVDLNEGTTKNYNIVINDYENKNLNFTWRGGINEYNEYKDIICMTPQKISQINFNNIININNRITKETNETKSILEPENKDIKVNLFDANRKTNANTSKLKNFLNLNRSNRIKDSISKANYLRRNKSIAYRKGDILSNFGNVISESEEMFEMHNKIKQCNELIDKNNSTMNENKKEISTLKSVIINYENTINDLKEKIKSKDNEFKKISEKNMEDFVVKEKKMMSMIDRISDLEAINYKLTHSTKDMDKKRIFELEKQIKDIKKILLVKDGEIIKLREKYEDLENKSRSFMGGSNNSGANIGNNISVINNKNQNQNQGKQNDIYSFINGQNNFRSFFGSFGKNT